MSTILLDHPVSLWWSTLRAGVWSGFRVQTILESGNSHKESQAKLGWLIKEVNISVSLIHS